MTERGLKNINVFYSTFINVFFIFVTFFTFFNVFYLFFLERFFTSMDPEGTIQEALGRKVSVKQMKQES